MDALYATRISPHIARTPEGYVVCLDVPLARTAVRVPQQYRGDELGLPTADVVDVYRPKAEVLSKRFLASLESKPLTDRHPSQFVSPENYQWHARGHVRNVRVGGALPDGEVAVLGDLVVTDAVLAEKILSGQQREVSVGYGFDIVEGDDGKISQQNLRANHVAIVAEARGGPQLRIQDAAPVEDFYAVCARYHRMNPQVVAESRSRRAADSANSGEPRSWDELATELGGLMRPREETMEKSEYKELIAAIERIERLFANGNVAIVEEAPPQGDWAEDGALADLRKLRPFIQASGDRVAIDSYNATVRMLKRMPRNLMTDAVETPRRMSREEIQQEFEDSARRYHRRNFHIRADREEQPREEPTVRVAEDSRTRAEEYADSMNRAGAEMRRKKK